MLWKNSYMIGFSLIELLTVLVIIGILISVAIPSYQNYIRRAHFSEVVAAASPYKAGVETCYQMLADLNQCNAGQHNVPKAVKPGNSPGLVRSIQVNNGQIILTPKNRKGIKHTDTLILKPHVQQGIIKWQRAGGSVRKGYVQ